MAIRTKQYHNLYANIDVKAIKITAANLTDIVAYICRNGGGATGHVGRPEFRRPARIRIKQITSGATWVKLDWRVAVVGDYIVRYPAGDFVRVKAVDFDRIYTAL